MLKQIGVFQKHLRNKNSSIVVDTTEKCLTKTSHAGLLDSKPRPPCSALAPWQAKRRLQGTTGLRADDASGGAGNPEEGVRTQQSGFK